MAEILCYHAVRVKRSKGSSRGLKAELSIELWPSPSEIRLKDEYGPYYAGLEGFYNSLPALVENLDRLEVRIEWVRTYNIEGGRRVRRAFPPETVELLAWLASSGVAAGLWKTLDLWTRYKNGRRIKVKFSGIEIETTQLGEKEFCDLTLKIMEFEKLRERSLQAQEDADSWLRSSKRKAEAEFSDYSPEPVEGETGRLEKLQLKTLYQRTRERRTEG